MPLPYGCARVSIVIQSSASAAARRRSCQVRSGSFGSVRWSVVIANQRASRSGSRRRRSATYEQLRGRGAPRGALEALADGDLERRADAVGRPDPRGDEGLPVAVLGVRELAEAAARLARRPRDRDVAPDRPSAAAPERSRMPSSRARLADRGRARPPLCRGGLARSPAPACARAVGHRRGHHVGGIVVGSSRRMP